MPDTTKAFDLSRNVFIQASAGAGKTWLLSKRYAAILNDYARIWRESQGEEQLDAGNILVITFTNKAAAEMSGRIYRDMNILLKGEVLEGTSDEFGQDLRRVDDDYKMQLRASFSQNAISTIDAFCARVLRENAQGAGVDPEFRLQDEVDFKRLQLETWHAFLAERSRKHDEDMRTLRGAFTVHRLKNYIDDLQNKSVLLNDWIHTQADSSPEQQRRELQTNNPLPERMNEIAALLESQCDDLPSASQMRNAEKREYTILRDLQEYLNNREEDPYFDGLKLLEKLRILVCDKEQTKFLNPKYVRRVNNTWPSDKIRDEMRDRRKAAVEQCLEWFEFEELSSFPNQWDWAAAQYTPLLCRFFRSYQKRLKKRSEADGVLTFDEVIGRTVEVLGDRQIAAEYARRFPHILVDEFQDTNDLRWEVVRLIASAGTGTLRRRGLFVVGDTKQSIYRFNQADVQVMNRVGEELKATGGLPLANNNTHRSARALVDTVINRLMARVFQHADEETPADYEARFQDTIIPDTHPMSDRRHALTRCKIQVCGKGDGPYPLHAHQAACEAADLLQWLKDNQLEPESGPHVGVLLRSFTRIEDYIRTFNALGLDFEVVASRGLYKQEESYDLFHLLSVLLNPLDDFALIGLLRSPVFAWTDQRIQQLANSRGDQAATGWVWRQLKQTESEVYDLILNWQRRSATQPADRLLNSILKESAEMSLGWVAELNGAARLANLDRLIHFVHKRSLEGQDLRQLYEHLKFQLQQGEDAQAELPSSARIQIMTIHKAKGLEFPAVVMPEIDRYSEGRSSGFYYWQKSPGLWEAAIAFDTDEGTRHPALLKMIRDFDRGADLAEDKRVFYVAVTRSLHAISFLGVETKGYWQSRSWWRRYLVPGFDLKVLLHKETEPHDPAPWLEAGSPEENFLVEHIQPDQLARTLGAVPRNRDAQKNFEPTEPCEVKFLEEISPHTVMSWVEGSIEQRHIIRTRAAEDGEEGLALSFGRFMHKIIEMGWTDLGRDAELIQDYLDEQVPDVDQHAGLLSQLEATLPVFLDSKLKQRLDSLPEEDIFPELPLMGWMSGTDTRYLVNGILDLLYRHEGEWYLVDYKTDAKPDIEAIRQGNHSYWFQVQTYQWMLKQSYGIDARASLFFLRHADLELDIPADPESYQQRLERLRGVEDALEIPRGRRSHVDGRLREIVAGSSPFILVEPTRGNVERRYASLAAHSLLLPGSQVMTLQELKQMVAKPAKRLNAYRTRIGAAHVLGRSSNWGTVNQLAAAFHQHGNGRRLSDQGRALWKPFERWCRQVGIDPDPAEYDWELLAGRRVVINGHFSTVPGDYAFLRSLEEKHAETVFIGPDSSTGLSWDADYWRRTARIPEPGELQFKRAYSVQEEVEAVARHLDDLLARGVLPQNIHVAVSSPERYVPVVKPLFADHGIPLRIGKREPLMERPSAQLLFAYLRLADTPRARWEDLAAVWLHPLLRRQIPDLDLAYHLDVYARREQLQFVSDVLGQENLSPDLNKIRLALKSFWEEVESFPDRMDLQGRSEALYELLGRVDTSAIVQSPDDSGVALAAVEKLKEILEDIADHWQRYGGSGLPPDLSRELRVRLENSDVASSRQQDGVELISYLETANLETDFLFVLGMTEGQFPLKPDGNPFLSTENVVPWHLNLYLLCRWLERFPDRLWLSAPERDVDGNTAQPSTFMEFFESLELPLSQELAPVTRRQVFHRLQGEPLEDAGHSPGEKRYADLASGQTSAYNGHTGGEGRQEKVDLSASSMDILLRCPQRFWYERILEVEPVESSIVPPFDPELGRMVHKLLETFGKLGGFRELHDREARLRYLDEARLAVMAKYPGLKKMDLLSQLDAAPYLENFNDAELNHISAMLEKEETLLSRFKEQEYYEQAFGLEHRHRDSWPPLVLHSKDRRLEIRLRGIIDRILVGPNGVWCVDYKTGKVEHGATSEFWSSQLLIYYLILKRQFPKHAIVMNFDRIPGYAANGVGLHDSIGEKDEKHPLWKTDLLTNKASLELGSEAWTTEDITARILDYGHCLSEGEYSLTQRDEKTACEHCSYIRICRKTALPG